MPVLTGNAQANTINGTQVSDIISGLSGNDVLSGRGGDDFLSGGPGFDQLSGGPGNDIFFVDPQDRPIDGGTGTDVVILAAGGDNFTYGVGSLRGIEGFQDAPGASQTNLTLNASAFNTTDGNFFRFGMGDGTDRVTLINDGRLSLSNGQLLHTVPGQTPDVIQFQGVESLTVIGQNGGTQVLTSQQVPPTNQSLGFVGPGSVAAKSAAAFALSSDPSLAQFDDLRPIADLLTQFRLEGNSPQVTAGDVKQTAGIIQEALGQGDVNQIADIIQQALGANGQVDQNAAIRQVAQATGGDVSQVASIVQKATDAALAPQAGAGTGSPPAGGEAANVSQSASIDQQASSTGGSVSQDASINQSAGGHPNDMFLVA